MRRAQASRTIQAAYNQWTAFGLNCTITSKSSATWDVDGGQGNYEVAGYWPSGGIMKDFYSAISGFDNQLIKPVGETGSGQGPALGQPDGFRHSAQAGEYRPEQR